MHMTATVYFSYVGTAEDWFDRKYYVDTHMPLVLDAWKPHGLLRAEAFFPAAAPTGERGTLVICEAIFEDEAAIEASFAAPETPAVIADVEKFTNLPLTQTRSKA
jgi:uncharacterized protein (TIGR02118 family)